MTVACALEKSCDRDVGPIRETVELLGYLCEKDNGVSGRVWQQRFVAVDYTNVAIAVANSPVYHTIVVLVSSYS